MRKIKWIGLGLGLAGLGYVLVAYKYHEWADYHEVNR
jgi:hypothetical protein